MIVKNFTLKICLSVSILCFFSVLQSQISMKDNIDNSSKNNTQERINAGEHPYDLWKKGIPLEDLYGLVYLEGYIFFIDVKDEYEGIQGMVCSLEDLKLKDGTQNIKWGCYGHDLIDLINVGFSAIEYKSKERAKELMEKDLVHGARIGDGLKNTNNILKECREKSAAAKVCIDQGEGWHLPSRGEVFQMYKNLYLKNNGNFSPTYYWSSTEFDSIFAWIQNFSQATKTDLQDGGHKKSDKVRLRAIKRF